MKIKFKKLTLPGVLLLILALLVSWYLHKQSQPVYSDSVQDIPAFTGEPYVVIGDNEPEFFAEDLTEESFEYYSPLDSLGRCGYAMACVGQDIMPTEDRESISKVKPSGWVQNQYDFVDGKSFYNRCHLIGFQLTGENANELNLITGTRYCNVEGMLPFENMIADYVKETGNHVIYRVTPIFEGDNALASGVMMEAMSMEDKGERIEFCVYVYNNQPGILIDYATGDSCLDEAALTEGETGEYILNTNSKKFHAADCGQANTIKDSNRQDYSGSRELLIAQGYASSGCCNP